MSLLSRAAPTHTLPPDAIEMSAEDGIVRSLVLHGGLDTDQYIAARACMVY